MQLANYSADTIKEVQNKLTKTEDSDTDDARAVRRGQKRRSRSVTESASPRTRRRLDSGSADGSIEYEEEEGSSSRDSSPVEKKKKKKKKKHKKKESSTDSELSEVEEKKKKKKDKKKKHKKQKKHKKHKKHRHEETESESGESMGAEELERKLREKALLSMKRQERSSAASESE